MRPRINFSIRAKPSVVADAFVAAADHRLDPSFIRVHGALRKRVTKSHRAENNLDQITPTAFEFWNLRTQWCGQSIINRTTFLDAENIHAQRAFKEFLVCLDRVCIAANERDASVGCGEKMTMDETRRGIRLVEKVRTKILRLFQRHVATRTIRLRLLRVIKTSRAVTRHAAEEVGVVMILAAQEFLILVQLLREADFVTGGAKFRRAHDGLEKGFLVELRLALDQLLVDVLQEAVRAVSEWIVDRLINRVVGIALGAVDVRDGMARRAGDARLGRGMIHIVEVWIVKRAAEERNDIVATRTPARGFDVAIALQ